MEWTWWCLVLLPPAWFLQLTIHELSHLLVGLVHEGLKPSGFYPYPHVHEGKFYFARYSYYTPEITIRVGPHKPRHIAPFFGGLLVLLVSAAAFFLLSPSGRPWTLPFAACGLGDMLWFWRGYFWGKPGNDGQRWRYGDQQ
jgi:hypothetical protein